MIFKVSWVKMSTVVDLKNLKILWFNSRPDEKNHVGPESGLHILAHTLLAKA